MHDIDNMANIVLKYNVCLAEKAYLKTFKNKEDLIVLHNNLGRDIRNAFDLWGYKWKPELVDGVDVSPDHPDLVSQRVIERVWEKLTTVP